jgi:hypothetical protein
VPHISNPIALNFQQQLYARTIRSSTLITVSCFDRIYQVWIRCQDLKGKQRLTIASRCLLLSRPEFFVGDKTTIVALIFQWCCTRCGRTLRFESIFICRLPQADLLAYSSYAPCCWSSSLDSGFATALLGEALDGGLPGTFGKPGWAR